MTTCTITGMLAARCAELSAGCTVNQATLDKWGINLNQLRRLAEGYKAGWLHNVMARITPLTMHNRNHYLAMADIFVKSKEEAVMLLSRLENDMELFCNTAGIVVTEHMNLSNVSPELQVHVDLYMDIAHILHDKFGLDVADPIANMVTQPLFNATNPFVKDYVEKRFG